MDDHDVLTSCEPDAHMLFFCHNESVSVQCASYWVVTSEQGTPVRKFSDIKSPIAGLAPRGTKTTIGVDIENFQKCILVLASIGPESENIFLGISR